MSKTGCNKSGSTVSSLRLRLGELVFPVLEPIFQRWENRGSDVRKHLHQGLICLDKGKTAIALLNLNMVLSLKPDHFLALVSRGRLYLKEGQNRLAAEDFFKASKASTYRFTHYDLYNEYLRSVDKDVNYLGASIVSNFTDVLGSLGDLKDEPETLESADMASFPKEPSTAGQKCEENLKDMLAFKRLTFSELDREEFDKFGPITQKEVDNTDWDQLAQDLTA